MTWLMPIWQSDDRCWNKITPRLARKLVRRWLERNYRSRRVLVGSYLASDVMDMNTGLVMFEAGA